MVDSHRVKLSTIVAAPSYIWRDIRDDRCAIDILIYLYLIDDEELICHRPTSIITVI